MDGLFKNLANAGPADAEALRDLRLAQFLIEGKLDERMFARRQCEKRVAKLSAKNRGIGGIEEPRLEGERIEESFVLAVSWLVARDRVLCDAAFPFQVIEHAVDGRAQNVGGERSAAAGAEERDSSRCRMQPLLP